MSAEEVRPTRHMECQHGRGGGRRFRVTYEDTGRAGRFKAVAGAAEPAFPPVQLRPGTVLHRAYSLCDMCAVHPRPHVGTRHCPVTAPRGSRKQTGELNHRNLVLLARLTGTRRVRPESFTGSADAHPRGGPGGPRPPPGRWQLGGVPRVVRPTGVRPARVLPGRGWGGLGLPHVWMTLAPRHLATCHIAGTLELGRDMAIGYRHDLR